MSHRRSRDFARTGCRRHARATMLACLASLAALLAPLSQARGEEMRRSAAAATRTRASAALMPERRRITDEDIHRDLATFDRWQRALDSLSTVEPRPSVYQLASAQGLLNFARQQYERGDRCGAVATAFDEGASLIDRMRGERDRLPAQPTILGAADVRPDLWKQAMELRGHSGFRCVEAQVARSEAMLLHAAHEGFERQPCDSTRLVTEAEALLDEARGSAQACVAREESLLIRREFNLPPPERRAVLLREIEELPKYVRFDLDSSRVDPATALILDIIANKLTKYSEIRVRLSGHTVSRSSLAYNLLLSKQRTESVRLHLVRAGIADDRMDVEYSATPMPGIQREKIDAIARDHCVVIEYMVPDLGILPATAPDEPPPPVAPKSPRKTPRKGR